MVVWYLYVVSSRVQSPEHVPTVPTPVQEVVYVHKINKNSSDCNIF